MSFSFSAPRVEYDEIAMEVANMTQEEQNAARGDCYGERPIITESEEMIGDAIQQLEICIESIHPKEAYDTAQIICPEYANSREFRLMFLRCERFDTAKAAQKIITYWDKKVDVWGEDKASGRLTLDDFDDEDQHALTMGGIKILPEQDDAGRGIIFSHRDRYDNRRTHIRSMLRHQWYIVEAALEDVNIQRNGILLIAYNGMPSHVPTNNESKLLRKLISLSRFALPMRLVGVHHILTNSLIKLVAENVMYWLGPELRARYKQHSGIKAEYFESLATHGIHRNMLPRVLGGQLEFDYEQWLGNRRSLGK